ncbi:MAG: beta-ketoacyl-[Kiritimatiellae bacterium]|nr:beta-ketoacyl-[acyl-carrier-protein] synthase family protein [Kiritimatiellia bacterium]
MSATNERIAIVGGDLLTAFGNGMETCWRGLLRGECALSQTTSDAPVWLGRITEIEETERRFDALLAYGRERLCMKPGEPLLICSTVGNPPSQAHPHRDHPFGEASSVISAACASSGVALCLAADYLCAGCAETVHILAADALSEFISSGFASLGAVGSGPAQPFDQNRDGLSLGEACAWMTVTTESAARSKKLPILGYLVGWGQRNDAHHLTAPHREARGLIAAIHAAINQAHMRSTQNQIVTFCAHGTGTRYNDTMELLAARSCCDASVPIWSVKGAIGHTLAACGLIEAWLCLLALRDGIVPQTIGCHEPENGSQQVTLSNTTIPQDGWALSTNSGFGGINTALLFERGDA